MTVSQGRTVVWRRWGRGGVMSTGVIRLLVIHIPLVEALAVVKDIE